MKTTPEQRAKLKEMAQVLEARGQAFPLSGSVALDLLADLEEVQAQLLRLQLDVGDACQSLNVAGPLSHRVRMYQSHYSRIISRQERLLSAARDFIVEGGSINMVGARELVDEIDRELRGETAEESEDGSNRV